jgi:hypothetical protein
MRLTKTQREQVRQMFGGRCAYCGCELPERWHVDHVEPVVRDLIVKGSRLTSDPTRCMHPERHAIENLMPACPPCNISKGSFGLERWRAWLAGHVSSLNSYHPIYRIAKAYGLVVETGRPVVFHFEQVATTLNNGEA